MIDAYSFGQIVVSGKQYTSDLIIFSDHVRDGWWRKEGHRLCIEDFKEALEDEPEVLVIGTGHPGLMKVPPDTRESIESMGIEVIIQPTGQAWQTFNKLLREGKKAVAAFHLTC